ncbi:MAG: hypothetical protein ACPGPS_19825, partial [Rubripirellula sp.]
MRRDFLKSCALTGLGLTAPATTLSAIDEKQELPPYEGPYYLVFNASGGWDTTYLMDPKGTDSINRLYQEDEILSHGNHRFAPTLKHKQKGLSNEDFYAEFGAGRSRGTLPIQLAGNLKQTGLVELAFGCTLEDLLM